MSYPDEYQVAVSTKRGEQLAGQKLRPGYEVVMASASVSCGGMGFRTELCIANLGGDYFVRSCNTTKDSWLQTFLFCPDKKVFAQ